jgi:hypothetical protein
MDRNGEERSVTRKEQPHDIMGTQKVRRRLVYLEKDLNEVLQGLSLLRKYLN